MRAQPPHKPPSRLFVLVRTAGQATDRQLVAAIPAADNFFTSAYSLRHSGATAPAARRSTPVHRWQRGRGDDELPVRASAVLKSQGPKKLPRHPPPCARGPGASALTAGQGLWVLVFAGACQGTAWAGLCLIHHHHQKKCPVGDPVSFGCVQTRARANFAIFQMRCFPRV